MTPAEEDIEVLWRGEIIVGSIIDRFRRDLGLDTCEALDEFLACVKKVRLEKVQRVGQRRRARAKRRAATDKWVVPL